MNITSLYTFIVLFDLTKKEIRIALLNISPIDNRYYIFHFYFVDITTTGKPTGKSKVFHHCDPPIHISFLGILTFSYIINPLLRSSSY